MRLRSLINNILAALMISLCSVSCADTIDILLDFGSNLPDKYDFHYSYTLLDGNLVSLMDNDIDAGPHKVTMAYHYKRINNSRYGERQWAPVMYRVYIDGNEVSRKVLPFEKQIEESVPVPHNDTGKDRIVSVDLVWAKYYVAAEDNPAWSDESRTIVILHQKAY